MNRNFLLAIDLGNSAISFCLFNSDRVLRHGFCRSNDIPFIVGWISREVGDNKQISCIISSVVPHFTLKLVRSLKRNKSINKVIVVGKDIVIRVPMKYRRDMLGADRLVNVYGARKLYPLPVLIFDFGTAITVDYVSRKGVFEGGLIIPGVELSARALEDSAALIPKIGRFKPVQGLVGHDTRSSFSSGLFNGFGSLADGLIKRFKRRYGTKMTVIATGGFAKRIARFVDGFHYVDELHTLKSLELIYRKEVREKFPRGIFSKC